MELGLVQQQPYSVKALAFLVDESESRSVIQETPSEKIVQWGRVCSLFRAWDFLGNLGSASMAGTEPEWLLTQYTTTLEQARMWSRKCADDRDQVTVRLEPKSSFPVRMTASTERWVLKAVLGPDDR